MKLGLKTYLTKVVFHRNKEPNLKNGEKKKLEIQNLIRKRWMRKGKRMQRRKNKLLKILWVENKKAPSQTIWPYRTFSSSFIQGLKQLIWNSNRVLIVQWIRLMASAPNLKQEEKQLGKQNRLKMKKLNNRLKKMKKCSFQKKKLKKKKLNKRRNLKSHFLTNIKKKRSQLTKI